MKTQVTNPYDGSVLTLAEEGSCLCCVHKDVCDINKSKMKEMTREYHKAIIKILVGDLLSHEARKLYLILVVDTTEIIAKHCGHFKEDK